MPIVTIGSIALDTISTPVIKRQQVVGGSALYSSLALSLFAPVQLVGVIGEDFPQETLQDLSRRGIDLAGVARLNGRTFAWEGVYGEDLWEVNTISTELNVFEKFNPSLPDLYRSSSMVFLGNIDPDLQNSVLQQLEGSAIVAADTMNHWLDLKLGAIKKLMPRLHVFFANEREAKKLSGQTKVLRAAQAIAAMGPRLIVIKSGEHGAMAYDRDTGKSYWAPAYPVDHVIDPTGAGDTFAGGFLGNLSCENNPFDSEAIKRSLVMGNVLASFTISSLGVGALQEVQRKFVLEKTKQYLGMFPSAESQLHSMTSGSEAKEFARF